LSKYPNPFRLIASALLLGALQVCLLSIAFGLDFGKLQQALIARFGEDRLVVFREWQQLVSDNHGTESDKLRRANDFFNTRIAFDSDISVWGQSDYWATPIETLGQGRGDCEDFSIAKYYSLLQLGVPVEKLRLVYVRASQMGRDGPITQAHMVLAYYATPNAEPLILDNLNPQILPASRRGDLLPVFSFNSAGLWMGTGNQSSRSNLSRWQDLIARARDEGFQ
jgi:predicted transglutaminase-like cysteine proteinase